MNTEEIWKDIPNYEGLYQVSNLGIVKSLRFNKEKILKQRISNKGYLLVNLRNNNNDKTYSVHKLVAITFLNHKPCGMKLVIDHIDNDKKNNNSNNLIEISNRENCSKDKKNKTSKYTGISFCKITKKWIAQIQINGVVKKIGYYINEDIAKTNYDLITKKLLEL
jgi:hypothetical protein